MTKEELAAEMAQHAIRNLDWASIAAVDPAGEYTERELAEAARLAVDFRAVPQ